ncbi:hypothetical protein BDM02DRAFT_3118769 [Thelephora ganbajun]|uniref:Uncharacterized protein n=1 Tax=Thelephora ganbajun TaxID=370292 RepID=A0ACB6Z9Y8_THEGA|nr:hypothetical protein BDM02DRAFT_3118769 [Thelephora ganbajun]
MKRLFGKKPKKSSEPSPKHIFPGIPANNPAGLLGFQAELGVGPDGEQIHLYHDPEETVAIWSKLEVLLSRIVTLEERFYSRPDDVEEQRRRDKLIRYVVIPSSDSVLNSFQRVRTHRRTTAASVREAGARAAC